MAGLVGKNGEKLEPDGARTAIENGMCPFCGAGPYDVPLKHISSIHGIAAREMREMTLVEWKQPLPSKEFHEKASAKSKRSSSAQTLDGNRYWDLEPSERDKHPYSTAGRNRRSWGTRDDLTDMVRSYRAAREAGIPKRNIAPGLAAEYGVSVRAIRDRLGKAVGLGMMDRSELPDWVGVRFMRSMEFHMNKRVGEVTPRSRE